MGLLPLIECFHCLCLESERDREMSDVASHSSELSKRDLESVTERRKPAKPLKLDSEGEEEEETSGKEEEESSSEKEDEEEQDDEVSEKASSEKVNLFNNVLFNLDFRNTAQTGPLANRVFANQ